MFYLSINEKHIYDDIINNLDLLVNKLKNVRSEEQLKYNKCLIEEKIYKIINTNIDKSITNLNEKEKNIILMKSTVSEESNNLTNNIIETLTKEGLK